MGAEPEAQAAAAVAPLPVVVAAAKEAAGDGESSSSSHRPRVPEFIADKAFEIKGRLGSGSYSEVHLGIDQKTGEKVAVKFEWVNADKTGKLVAEAKLCHTFDSAKPGVPPVRWSGSEGEYNIMVMDLLGPSLEDLMEACGGRFSVPTVLMLGIQMVDLLEYVHSFGIIHRDIKPNNFLIGHGANTDRVYIVDFGLAKRYRNPETGDHIPCIKKKGLTGTVRYTSLNIHRGLEPSRRDDLGAVGYVLMYFALGRLPWQGISAKSKKTKQRRIGRRKESFSHRDLCHGYPDEFWQYLEYCDELRYEAQPDYDYLRRLLRAALARLCPGADEQSVTASGLGDRPVPFDWRQPGASPPAEGTRKRSSAAVGPPEPPKLPAPAPPPADAAAPADGPQAKRLRVVDRLPAEAKENGAAVDASAKPPAPPDPPEPKPEAPKEEGEEESDEYEYDSEEYEYDTEEEDEEEDDDDDAEDEEEEEKEGDEEEDEKKDKAKDEAKVDAEERKGGTACARGVAVEWSSAHRSV